MSTQHLTPRRWVPLVAAGEWLGFLVPAVVGSVAAAAGLSAWPFYLAMVAAGAVEGLVLGVAQGTALHRAAVPVSGTRWALLTSGAAAGAWAIGMLPSTLTGVDWTSPTTIALAVLGAVALLCSIPSAQWLELRRVVPRAWRWLPINVVAWGAGLLWTFAPSPLVDERTRTPVLIAAFVVAGALMALTMAVVTGVGLRRYMLDRAPLSAPGTPPPATTTAPHA